MSVVFLIHHIEDESFEPLRVCSDMLCAMYGYHLRIVDQVGDLLKLSREPYADLDEALTDPRFAGWTWVFFDPDGNTALEDFTHPADDVVYVFGGDIDGFDRDVALLPGETIQLKSVHSQTYQHHALACVSTVATHRFYQVDIANAGVMNDPMVAKP